MVYADTVADWNIHDVRFHLAILNAAGNELLVPLGFMIESALSNMFAFTATHNEDMRKALPLHEAILTAIKRRNPDAARKAARLLLADTNNVIGRSGKRAARAAKGNGRKRSAYIELARSMNLSNFARYPSLRGKSVFVTGGGSGIGAAIVESFLDQGAKVAFVDIAETESRALCDALKSQYDTAPSFIRCDITDIAALQAAIA